MLNYYSKKEELSSLSIITTTKDEKYTGRAIVGSVGIEQIETYPV